MKIAWKSHQISRIPAEFWKYLCLIIWDNIFNDSSQFAHDVFFFFFLALVGLSC